MKQVHLDRFDPDLPTVLLAVHAQAANAVAGNRLFRLPIRMQPLEYFVCWHATADPRGPRSGCTLASRFSLTHVGISARDEIRPRDTLRSNRKPVVFDRKKRETTRASARATRVARRPAGN